MFDVREVVGRPSLDTFYQVTFSFGKWQNWLESANINRNAASSRRRSSGNDFMEKMSLMCAEAELPGTSFQTSLAVGHHQGIQEEFPNLRTFPPLNLTFYCDLDHVIIEVLEPSLAQKDIVKTQMRMVDLIIQRITKKRFM